MVKAIQTDAEYVPVSGTRTILLLGRGGSTYSGGDYDQVVVTAAASGAVTLKDMLVRGDVLLYGGVDVTLDNTSVRGTVINGDKDTGSLMGEEDRRPSIIIRNASDVGSIRVTQTESGGLRVRTEEGCRVEWVYVDDGLGAISLEGSFNQIVVDTQPPVSLSGATASGLTVKKEEARVELKEETRVTAVLIQESAAGASLAVEDSARVTRVDACAENASITGRGEVKLAEVSGSGTAVDTLGTYLLVDAQTENVTVQAQPVSQEAITRDTGFTTTENGAEETAEPPAPAEHTAHSWGEGVILSLPTEEQDGECVYVCTVCGEKWEEILPRAPFAVALEPQEEGGEKTRLYFSTLEEAIEEAQKTTYSTVVESQGSEEEWLYRPTIEVRGNVTLDTLELPAGCSLAVYGTLTVRDEIFMGAF